MRNFTFRYLPVLVLMAIGIFGANIGARTPRKTIPDSDRLKAEYLFMEANSRLQNNELGTAYYMMRRAAELDSTDPEIAGALAEITIFAGLSDSAGFERAYNDLRRRFLANPKDFQNGLRFVSVATQLRRETDIRDTYRMLSEAYPNRSEYAVQYAVARAFDYNRGDTAAADEAISILDKLESAIGLEPNIILNKLQVYMITGDTAAMVNEVQRFAATAPDDAEINYFTGQLFNTISMPDSAICYYNRSCELDSTLGASYLARAEYYLAKGDSVRYGNEVVKVLESSSIDFQPKLDILTNYTRNMYQNPESRERVTGVFERMVDIHSSEPQLRYLYAAYLAAIDSTARAAEQFGYAMDLDPNDSDYPRFRIQTSMQAGDTLQAVSTAAEAARRFHDVSFSITGSSLLMLQDRSEEALAMLDSFKINGDEPPAAMSVYYQQRGDILYRLEQVDSALACYEYSLKFDPENVGSLNNLAYFLSVDGRELDKAEAYVKKAIEKEPLNPTYLDTYAWVLYKKKDYGSARRQIDEVLRLYSTPDTLDTSVPEQTESTDTTGVGAEHAEQVIEEVEEMLEIETPSAEVYDHAGDIYFMCGEPEDALKFWKEALKLEPDNKKIKQKIKNRKIE